MEQCKMKCLKDVCIRKPVLEELNFILSMWADPITMKDVGGPVYLTQETGERWFEQMIHPGNSESLYCLILVEGVTPVGEIGYQQYNPDEKSAELNVKIHHPYLGRGYGHTALRMFLDYFFNVFGGEKVIDNIPKDNFECLEMMERMGFIPVKETDLHIQFQLIKHHYNQNLEKL